MSLKNKLADSQAVVQMLKDRILIIENETRSKLALSSKKISETNNQETELTSKDEEISALSKDLRILKNNYEIEMRKAQDENERLQRKLTEKLTDIPSQTKSISTPINPPPSFENEYKNLKK